METATYISLLLCFPLLLLMMMMRQKGSNKHPPGSFGIPLIGQSFGLLKVMRANTTEEWLHQLINKYGPIFKLHIVGTPTVFLHGQAANKFIYTCNDKILSNQQPASLRRLVGERNILELSGQDHKRIRGALVSFLKPEALKQSVGRIDEEIKLHLNKHWHGRNQIDGGEKRYSYRLILGCAERNTISASKPAIYALQKKYKCKVKKIRKIIVELIHEKREKLQKRQILDHQDLITSLLSVHGETTSPLLSDEEIVDNCIAVMMAGYDTTSVLLSFLIKLFAENQDVYRNVLEEHEEIARGKAYEDRLTWEDLAKMKYTWRVATESLRMNPPVLFSFRKVLEEFEIEGYVIPKGWQVMWASCMTHMDESIFADPSKFDPSRFDNQAGIPAYSFIAFGGGPRMCPGYEFARIETLTLIHYLVTGLEWKLCFKENSFARDPLPVFNNGLPVHIELKKHSDHVL